MSDWACQHENPEIFFMPQTTARAKKICTGCPAKDPCFAMVKDIEETFGRQEGVWAGTSKEDRRALYPVQVVSANW